MDVGRGFLPPRHIQVAPARRTTSTSVEGTATGHHRGVPVERRQRAEQELLEKNQQLEALSASLENVRESERRRIARELHDELAEDTEEGDDHRGVFAIEPLDRGFGYTFGNSLRRVLLSSLEGAAVTAVKIEGVAHEFTTLPGVREDVVDIVLNIKAMAVRMQSDRPHRLVLKATGRIRTCIFNSITDNGVETRTDY